MIADWKTIELCGKPKNYGFYLVTVKRFQEFSLFRCVEVCYYCTDTGKFLTREYEGDLIPSEVVAYCEAPKPYWVE